MDLNAELLAVGAGERAPSFEIFSQTIDPEWITQALAATGMATIRRRKLPAEYVVWLVIGMALLRDRSIREVVRHLDLVLPTGPHRATVSGSAIVQARDRLGSEPLAALFAQAAAVWGPAAADAERWRGLAVYGVDGTTLRVPDTPDNEAAFGRVPTRWESTGGYPLMRLVALMVLRRHVLTALALGAYRDSELKLAADLWPQLPDAALVILDREFSTYALFHQLSDPSRQRHWLSRVRTGPLALRRRVVQRLGPGDHLVDLTPSRRARRLVRHGPRDLPPTLRVRAIRYQRRGFRAQMLLTSLLDPVAYPAAEIIALYHERWELELGFDEVKTHTLEREEALRSKTPARLTQEVWGLALGYNLVRLAMARVAERAAVAPTRISYRHALQFIRLFWLTAWTTTPAALPRRLEALHDELSLLILPERRPQRRYPRAVKIKLSGYPRKHPRSRRNHAK
jgi:Insertion element 4 transposase N-terminal/Transposase DDE domain